eukprot:713077_1
MAEEQKQSNEDNKYERTDFEIEQYVKMSINPQQNPMYPKLTEIVKNIGNLSNKTVVDVGCGAGIMLPMFSDAVGEKGAVYAVDVDKNFLSYCSTKVIPTLKHKNNVNIIQSKANDLCLPDKLKGNVDVFMLAFVLYYLQEKQQYKHILAQISEYLSNDSKGQVIVLDFDQQYVDELWGLSEEETNKYLTPKQIEELFNVFGFVLDRYILRAFPVPGDVLTCPQGRWGL